MFKCSLKYGHSLVSTTTPSEPVQLDANVNISTPIQHEALLRILEEKGLFEAIQRAKTIAVVVNDQTRKTGIQLPLQVLHRLFEQTDLTPKQITCVIAYGLHARQSDTISQEIYGRDILERVSLVHHDARDSKALVTIGSLPDGNPISIACAVAEADLRILLGSIGFHYYAGFSGGRKSILPGVADEASIVRNHLKFLDPKSPHKRAVGCAPAQLDKNPVSDEMFAAAQLLDAKGGRTFLLNTITSHNHEIIDVACGFDHEHQFREGCARFHAKNIFKISDVSSFDTVVASAGGWPYDASLYQAHKAYDNAFRALAPCLAKGDQPTLIFVARCNEGLGHSRFQHWLQHATREEHYNALVHHYEIVGQTSLAVRDKAAATKTIAVTELDSKICEQLGWVRVQTLEEAFSYIKTDRPWGLMPNAARVLPVH